MQPKFGRKTLDRVSSNRHSVSRVEGEDVDAKQTGESESGPKKRKKISREEFEKYSKSMQAFIDRNRASLESFAGDASIKFKASTAFMIDFERGEVHCDATWFHEKKFTEEQMLWAMFHELSHFKDYADSRKELLDNYDYIERKAKQLAPLIERKVEEIYGESHPEIVEKIKQRPESTSKKEEMTWAEGAAYKMYHAFYNCMDDIHVNARLAWHAPRYQQGAEGGDEVKKLYRDKLFPTNDYAEYPKHLQYAYKLLREAMVPEQSMILNEEVWEAHQRELPLLGKKQTATEWVREILIPGVTKDKMTGRRVLKDTKAGARNSVIRQTMEPVFEQLLRQDLEAWKPRIPVPGEEEEEGGGPPRLPDLPFQDEYDEFEFNSPDQISDQDAQGFGGVIIKRREAKRKQDEAAEKRAKEDASKTPEQRAQEAADRANKDWCEKNKISYEEFLRFQQLERDVQPYLNDLSDLWTKLLRGQRVEQGRRLEGSYPTGELNVPRTIQEWPKIAGRKFDEVRVMDRQVPKETVVRKPDEIRIRLLGDVSGSMSADKRLMLSRVATLILSSVREFNARMAWQSSEGNAIQAKSQVVLYGSQALETKSLEGESDDQEKVEMRTSVTECQSRSLGGTADALALQMVWDGLDDPDEQEKIRSGKVIDLVFEITDGGTFTLDASKELIDKLKRAGVIVKAFQVGKVDEYEQAIFQSEWNSDGDEDGKIVGDDLAKVVPAIAEMLEKYIGERFG